MKEKVTFTFGATFGDRDEDITKATFNRSGQFGWQVGDAVRFYDTAGNYHDGAVNAGLASVSVEAEEGTVFVSATYPAAAATGKYQISFNNRGPVVVADASGSTLAFYHIGSLMNIKINSIPAATASLVLTASSSNTYTGAYTFTEGVPALTTTATPSTVTVTVPATTADEATDITLCLPNMNLPVGTAIALKNSAGFNLYRKEMTIARDLSTRPTLLNMKALTYEAPRFYYISTADGSHAASYLPMIKTGSSTFEANLQMDAAATYKIYDEYNKNQDAQYVKSGTCIPSLDGEFCGLYIIGTMESANWSILNTAYQMKRVHGTDWVVRKNVKFSDASAAFKIYEDTGNWDNPAYGGGSEPLAISVGTTGGMSTEKTGSSNITVSVDKSKNYDVFLNTSSGNVRVVLSSDNHNPLTGIVEGIHSIIYNTSTGVVDFYHQYANRDKPWADDNVQTKLRLIGYTDGWTGKDTELTLTYNGNDGWYYNGLVITSAGEKHFKFKIAGDDYSWFYNWGLKDAQSVNAGTNNYGAAVAQDATGENTITLAVGTYDVYLNAYSWYDNKKMNYMFIKK